MDKLENICVQIIPYQRFSLKKPLKQFNLMTGICELAKQLFLQSLDDIDSNGKPRRLDGKKFETPWDLIDKLNHAEPNSLVLIENVEVGLHHRLMDFFMREIWRIGKKLHCQIIMTTYSYEIIEHFYKFWKETGEEYGNFFRLDKAEHYKLADVPYDLTTLGSALEMHMEVR